jgi:hypothetical protein
MARLFKTTVKLIASSMVLLLLAIAFGSGCQQRPSGPPAQAPVEAPSQRSMQPELPQDADQSKPLPKSGITEIRRVPEKND